jgi:hypothetical protein
MGNLNYMWLLISGTVATGSLYALFSIWISVWPMLHPLLGIILPAYVLSPALGLLFGRWSIVAITPMAYVAALTIFWLTLCSQCGLYIGRWETYGFFALLGLPTFITAGLGVWIRVLATKNRG